MGKYFAMYFEVVGNQVNEKPKLVLPFNFILHPFRVLYCLYGFFALGVLYVFVTCTKSFKNVWVVNTGVDIYICLSMSRSGHSVF